MGRQEAALFFDVKLTSQARSQMINQAEARRHILGLWPSWAAQTLDTERRGNAADAMLFFAFVSADHPYLLDFAYRGPDKAAIVYTWLSRARCCE
jgi:hypothetical protein